MNRNRITLLQMQRVPRSGAALALILGVLLNVAPVKAAEVFEGSLQSYANPADIPSTPVQTARFRLILQGNEWRMAITNIAYRGDSTSELATEYCTDGVQFVTTTYWSKEALSTSADLARMAGVQKYGSLDENKPHSIRLRSSSFPVDLTPIPAAPWLAYSLPVQLSEASTRRIPNVFTKLAWNTNSIRVEHQGADTRSIGKRMAFYKPPTVWLPGNGRALRAQALGGGDYVGLVHEVTASDPDTGFPTSFRQTHHAARLLPGGREPAVEPTCLVVCSDVVHSTRKADGSLFKEYIGGLRTLPATVHDARINISPEVLVYDVAEFGILNWDDPDLPRKTTLIRKRMRRGW